MLFSSPLFLYLFLPIVLIGYYFTPKFLKNLWLILASFIFFAWGGVGYSLILICSILWNYVFGILIGNNLGSAKAKIYLTIGVGINLLLLCVFKYADFIVQNINIVFSHVRFHPLPNPEIALPIGISFYTFHSLSYLVDIYRRDADAQRKPVDLMLYISFFPQLVAGPIIRYHDIAYQLDKRTHTVDKFSYGIKRFIIGLAKKVLLANSFGLIADKIFSSDISQLSAINAWLGLLSYTFQIYMDFSGYSDMAIGLALMFGFEFPENFNFPYVSKSIKEFWHRWHISLSTWFRDYLYIPLGGNKINNRRTYINLFIVFLATGFWHGASWTFVVWGLYHGFFLILERIGFDKVIKRMPNYLANVYAFLVVMLGWVLFRADSFGHAWQYYKALFNFEFSPAEYSFFKMNFTIDYWVVLFITTLGAFGVFTIVQRLITTIIDRKFTSYFRYGVETCYVVFLLMLLAMSTVYLLAGTYNPFIYYRF